MLDAYAIERELKDIGEHIRDNVKLLYLYTVAHLPAYGYDPDMPLPRLFPLSSRCRVSV